MQVENRHFAFVSLGLASLFILYYTIWVIVLPFVDSDYSDIVQTFFYPVEVALGVPAALGSAIFLSLLARAYYLVCKDRANDPPK